MNLQNLESDLKKAIDVRESGNLSHSRILLESLVKETKKLVKDSSPRNLKNFYVTLMGEYVIQFRLEGKGKLAEALKLGQEVYKFNQDEGLKNFLGPRSVAHTLQDLGDFEGAEVFSRELIELVNGNPFRQGDEMAHLALGLLRMGRIKEAQELIEKSLKQISEYSRGERYSGVTYSAALMIKALILNAGGNSKEALNLVREALTIAKKDKLHFRIFQAEKLIKFLSSGTRGV